MGRPVAGSMGAATRLWIPERSDPHRSQRPSGLQAGARSMARSSVRRATTRPSEASRTTTSRKAPGVQREAATQRPSGDTAGKVQWTSGSGGVRGTVAPSSRETRTRWVEPSPERTATAEAPSGNTDGWERRAPRVSRRVVPSPPSTR